MAGESERAARRGARALLRVLGAETAVMEMPAPPVPDDVAEELGLSAPEFQRRELAPVAVRRTVRSTEIAVDADTLEAFLGVTGSGAVHAAAKRARTVLIGDERFVIRGMRAVVCPGGVCLYRLLLEPVAGEVV